MTTTDIDAIMRAILEEPEDDLHRLAFADWHEEYGDRTLAEFVRLQIEFARTLCTTPPLDSPADPAGVHCHDPSCRHCAVGQRALALWHDSDLDLCSPDGLLSVYESWSRGFFSVASCTLGEFMVRAAELFAASPITWVWLTDCKPYVLSGSSDRYAWWDSMRSYLQATFTTDGSDLPKELFTCLGIDDHVATFPSEARAHEALSAACVRYGRIAAGLEKPV